MRCLSCQQLTTSTEARVVLRMYLCRSCAELAAKAEQEVDAQIEHSRVVAKNALAEHVMQGGLLRPRASFEDDEITKEFPISKRMKQRLASEMPTRAVRGT
jgi:disulfide oxidoreductase YuzD